MNTNKFLTIVIPTYNRERQLLRLLRSIERQNAIDKYYIVILNNHSDYDLEASIRDTFSGDFLDNIEIYNRPYNSGGDYNIASAFLFAKTDYLWIIGDDDEVLDGCIDIIVDDMEKYPNVPYFKYHIEGHSTYNEDLLIGNMPQFKKLFKSGCFSAGDIIFLSNNVYNLKKAGQYISTSLYYSYCSVPHSIPMLRCLSDESPFVWSHREIIKYHFPDGDHWNYVKIVTSLSTVLDINVSENYKATIEFFNAISKHFRLQVFLEECLKIADRRYRKYVCEKGMMTLFKRKSCSDCYNYSLYKIENAFGVKVFSLHLKASNLCEDYLHKKKRRMKESNHVIYRLYTKMKNKKCQNCEIVS